MPFESTESTKNIPNEEFYLFTFEQPTPDAQAQPEAEAEALFHSSSSSSHLINAKIPCSRIRRIGFSLNKTIFHGAHTENFGAAGKRINRKITMPD